MALQEIQIQDYREKTPFSLLNDDWALLSAGSEGDWNTMTVSWGQVGVLWNRNVATVYVRPQRHTLDFIQRYDRFTLSFFPSEYRDALAFCGRYSGRDVDKAKETGLHPVFENGTVTFQEAKLVLQCRKLYCQPLVPECFTDETVRDKNYPAEDYHFCFIGEIEHAFG